MAMRKRSKQWICAAAVSAVVWTGTLGAVPPAFAASNPFSDVKVGHWAEKHVVKLALQGIISGKGQGIFDPSGNIRREDAVIVALKFMGLADDVNSSGTIAFPSTFQVDDYAKPYVMEAMKRKLLSADEEYALANAEPGKPWGKTPATREWVAKLLVRAINKESEASANAGKATAFSDNGKIDDKLRPYVLTAVQEGLVAGVTPTTFEPKSAINRASIATLFSKAESKVNAAYSGQVSGLLLAVGADKLTMLHDDGTIHDYVITSNTMYARYDSDLPAGQASLKLYGKAILIHDANGAIGYVEQTDDKAYIKSIDGTFSSINTTDSKIWLSVGEDFNAYAYDAAHKPVVTDAQGKTIDLKDVPKGAAVSLKVDTLRTEGKVVSIAVKQSVINKTGSGTVVSWSPASGVLQVTDSASGGTENLTVSQQAVFKQGDVYVNADTLKAGDSITYEVKAGSVVSVSIAKPAVTSVSGKLFNWDKLTKTIQYTVNGDLTAKFMVDSPTVKIEGMSDATLDDLQKDDAVTMTLDASGRVTQIAVSGRNVQMITGATVAAYIAQTKTLSLTDAGGNPRNFILNANVRYDLNGAKLDAAQALTMLAPGKKITVGYSGANAVTIYFVAKYAGTVLENNMTSRTLKVQVDASNTITLPYGFPYVEIYGQSSTSNSDVKVGDTVTAILNGNQDQITTIQVQKAAQLEVVSVDAANAKVRLRKAGTSTIEEWAVPSTAAVQDENGATISLSQLAPGTVANVTFMGRTAVVKIKTVSVTYGKIVSVNTAGASVDISVPGGGSVTKSVGTQPLIMRGSTTVNTLSSLQPDERVEIRKDENDRTVIEVVNAVRKEFWFYDAASNTIQVKRSNFSENNVFSLDAQTYIHQGATTLTASQLKDGDQLSIYTLRGKVVEIVK